VIRCFSSFKLTGSGGTKSVSLMYPHKKKSQGVQVWTSWRPTCQCHVLNCWSANPTS